MPVVGDYARANLLAVERAEMMQALALDSIKKMWFNQEVDPLEMTLGEFIKAQIEAEEAGTREEFEAKLAEKLMPILDQVFAAQQQAVMQ